MKLLVVSDYTSNRARYKAGDMIDIDPNLAAWLLNDAPACFEIPPEKKAMDEPPADKQIKRPSRKK